MSTPRDFKDAADLDDEAVVDAYDAAEDERAGLKPCVRCVQRQPYQPVEPCPCVREGDGCTCLGHEHLVGDPSVA